LNRIAFFDIGIMPLEDNEWNRGKCGFKLLQYMGIGIPAVASPVGVNSMIIREGHNGFLANTEKEWEDKLSFLLGNPAEWQHLGRNARETVEKGYSVKVMLPRLVQVLREVCGEENLRA
ncbi:MAG: glycosyltransferase, partial [Firmicutes bacterium]|nr:glycosyltransferase [Bacillota bacterium]